MEENVCRICLQSSEKIMNSIFIKDEHDISLAKKIENCCGVEISKSSGFPTRICNICEDFLCIAYKLRTICQNSDDYLRRFIKKDRESSENEDNSFEHSNQNAVPNQYGAFDDGEISDNLSIKSNPETPTAIKDENLEETLSETSLKIDKKPKKSKKLKTKNRKEQHDSKRPIFECTVCDQTFDRRESFLHHKRSHHTPDTFQCNHCDKHFVRKRNLLRHMKIHKETGNVSIEPHSKHELCPFCGKSYTQTSLAIHIRRHTGEKPYKCDICDKGYPRSHDLMIHKRSHTGERPHVCPTCGKGFIRPNKLTRHIRVHTGERPYQCTQCGKGFAQSNDLNLHIRRHTGEKPYKCGVCHQGFINGTALRNHHKSTDHYSTKDQCPDRFEKIRVDNPYRKSYQTCWRTKALNTKQDIEVIKACSDENNEEKGVEDLRINTQSTDWTAHN